MSESSDPLAKALAEMGGAVLKEEATRLSRTGLTLALLGNSTTLAMRAGRGPGEDIESGPVAVVLVLSGKIPDDVVDTIIEQFKAAAQDATVGGQRIHVQDDFKNDKKPDDEP